MNEQKPKLLVVDDEEKNIHAIRRILESMDIEIYEASSGQNALLQVLHHKFFLILMDVQMPEMSGFETAELMLENRKTSQTPIIFITAVSKDERYVAKGYHSGAVDYIYKPIDPLSLTSKVSVFRQLWVQRLEIEQSNVAFRQLNRQLLETSETLQRSNEELEHIALHDALTGLANRRLFLSSLEKAIERSKRVGTHLAIFFLDLDNFKGVNDTLGHNAGDELLVKIAERLKMSVRTSDLIARLGGDEFAIMAEEIKVDLLAASIAQHILDVVSLPIEIRGHTIYQTPSIGIASYPSCGTDVDSLMQSTDTAMYRAKKDGRNNYRFYSEKLHSLAAEYAGLTVELKRALEADQLEVYYQPQIQTQTGQVGGLEALVRWHHPERGLICANDFIAVAEHSGLIRDLGSWVLEKSCVQFSQWIDEGIIKNEHLTIGVNISTNQFHQKDWVQSISDVISRSAIRASQLELEITETAIIDDMEYCIELLQRLIEIGVMIAIDDFGTGYASYRHLQQLPVHTLKIDKSFIDNIPGKMKDVEIVKAIITMAKALGLKISVEGVETQQQVQMLKEEQVDLLQGYYFYRPMTAEKMAEVLKEQNTTSS
jgi:diguanylate cyclase (GGDEF)-like protein